MQKEEAYKEKLTLLEENVKKLKEELAEFGEIIKQSDATIEEYKTDNEDLRIKMWKAIRKIQSKEEELDEKDIELETAEEVIEKLRERLLKHGEELDESDDDNYDNDDDD